MTGAEWLDALRSEFAAPGDAALARILGVTAGRVSQMRRQKSVSARAIAAAFQRARKQAVQDAQSRPIQPVVEFFPTEIDGARTVKALFDASGSTYKQGLKAALGDAAAVGLYVFYDSQGKAIYAGKTQSQTLWKEMNLALNRRRGADVQNVFRITHPERNQPFVAGYELSRQIRKHPVGLWELVNYFSAYIVHPGMIGDMEALLVRAFANDLLNKKMERFSHVKNAC